MSEKNLLSDFLRWQGIDLGETVEIRVWSKIIRGKLKDIDDFRNILVIETENPKNPIVLIPFKRIHYISLYHNGVEHK